MKNLDDAKDSEETPHDIPQVIAGYEPQTAMTNVDDSKDSEETPHEIIESIAGYLGVAGWLVRNALTDGMLPMPEVHDGKAFNGRVYLGHALPVIQSKKFQDYVVTAMVEEATGLHLLMQMDLLNLGEFWPWDD